LGTQLHDFSPWTLPNGLFWIVKVPDSAVQITEDSLTIHLVDVPTVDAFKFPPPPQDVPGISPFKLIPAKVSFDVTYTKKSGTMRRIRPASHDPLSPLNWAGQMWDATNSGTFSLAYNDGTFSASGSFASLDNFGEMGTERNGFFVNHEEEADNDDVEATAQSLSLPLKPTQMSQLAASGTAKEPVKLVLLKGRVPVKVTH
jgi:hypothetical protein